MTKKEAIDKVKSGGWSAWHTETNSEIFLRTVWSPGEPSYEKLQFAGDCSPQDGWDAEWLGER